METVAFGRHALQTPEHAGEIAAEPGTGGGTAAATCRLAERTGATVVGVSVVIDLSFLPWREALAGRRVEAVIAF